MACRLINAEKSRCRWDSPLEQELALDRHWMLRSGISGDLCYYQKLSCLLWCQFLLSHSSLCILEPVGQTGFSTTFCGSPLLGKAVVLLLKQRQCHKTFVPYSFLDTSDTTPGVGPDIDTGNTIYERCLSSRELFVTWAKHLTRWFA